MRGIEQQPRSETPRHLEMWGQLESSNRFLRRLAGVSIAWAFCALAFGFYGLEVALYRPLAFHVDEAGAATFVGRLRDQLVPTDVEARYVAKEFLKRYVAVNGLTIEADLAESWKMMTSEMQANHASVLAKYEKDHGESLASFAKRQEIQTMIEFEEGKLELVWHDKKVITVRIKASLKNLSASAEGGADIRPLDAFITLVTCPRSESTPNGLLVAKLSHHIGGKK